MWSSYLQTTMILGERIAINTNKIYDYYCLSLKKTGIEALTDKF
jgi:hypothetical protein